MMDEHVHKGHKINKATENKPITLTLSTLYHHDTYIGCGHKPVAHSPDWIETDANLHTQTAMVPLHVPPVPQVRVLLPLSRRYPKLQA